QGMETRLLSVDSVPCLPELSDFFGLHPETPVFRVQRIGIADGRPFSYVTHFLPAALMKRIQARDLRRHSMSKIFEERLGYTIGEYHQTIEARIADHRIAELLGVGITSPVVYIETFSRSDKGEALEFFRSYYSAGRYKYAVVLRKDGARPVFRPDGRRRAHSGRSKG
ncbi:MAG: UTRA domain-containing protein, partial [Nitrospinota bacterium]